MAVPRLASVASYHLVAATAGEADNQNANAGLVRYVNAWRTNGHYFASVSDLVCAQMMPTNAQSGCRFPEVLFTWHSDCLLWRRQ